MKFYQTAINIFNVLWECARFLIKTFHIFWCTGTPDDDDLMRAIQMSLQPESSSASESSPDKGNADQGPSHVLSSSRQNEASGTNYSKDNSKTSNEKERTQNGTT